MRNMPMRIAVAMSSLVGLLLVGAPANAQSPECSCVSSLQSSVGDAGMLVSSKGDVRVLRASTFVDGQAGDALAVGNRVIVGQQSMATIALSGGCQLQVNAGETAGIAASNDKICLRILDDTTTAQITNSGNRMPLVIFGGLAGTIAFGALVGGSGVSQ